MDGASAIITFVVVALQSAKAVHGTLSAVKDGPHNLQNVIHSVEELKNILERVENILRSGSNRGDVDLIAFSGFAERCAEDMRRFDEGIGKLIVSPKSKKLGRFWKRLKTALDEKELDRMRSILQSHTSSLALRIITYQSAQTSASASQISRIQDIVETLGDHFSRLNHHESHPKSLLSHGAEGTTALQIKPTWTSELEHSISRLCDLVDAEGQTRDSDYAEQLIEDLKKLLDTAYNLESQIPEIGSAAETSLGSYVEPASNLAKELKLASSLVSSAPFISINSKEQAKRYKFNSPPEMFTQQQRKRKFIDMEHGTLTVTTNKRCRITRSQRDRTLSQTTPGTATHAVRNPSMCKYLIQNGLDVDEVVGWTSYETTPLHEAMNYSNSETAALLLEAGADPTVDFRGTQNVICRSALGGTSMHDLVLGRILIDSHHLDVFNQRDAQGKTPFLTACSHADAVRSVLELFVEKGSNIHDRNYDGETCLHRLCSKDGYSYIIPENMRDCLDFLLEQGADLRVTDDKGRSVADVAYSHMGTRFRGMVGDVFDACLARHGYDLYEFRKRKPRVARYNEVYQRIDFERLWEGIEDQCPYWDDKPWPSDEHENLDECDDSACSGESFEDETFSEGTDVDTDMEYDKGGDYYGDLFEEYDESDERSGTGTFMATDEVLEPSVEEFDENVVGS
ncbi:uncharacterized protein N0V89_001439 [Didymosphaeria variabile]|uniref:Azaphilone pigments biosynthesis cluster protein L N-terminal domain-containing protein n=1 Tax=Didymosphaeria variabile TaxID=1932322 RepID=A0A9W9CGQ7_9PLEO|nr:uncharacterized protein N0V89_001439 [Didymosphaeria variabile]KAJ4360872.1 hypothetical protein N0V89_001439 [Didymosphaeria variabile]